jgi:hypothetical protein
MLSGIPAIVGGLTDFFWPIILFFILVPLTTAVWLYWRQEIFKRLEQVLFEMKMPREILRSPQAMEQVLAAVHALRNAPGDIGETWVDGEIPRTFSLEVVSFGGEIHFYVRCYWKSAPLVKAAFFSYYPDIELVPQDADYVTRFPDDIREMNAQGYEMYGTEITLKKESAFPLRSYKDFESPDEDKTIDPMGAFIEFLGQVQREQIVAVQILITPCAPDWHHKWKPLVEKLKESASTGTASAAMKSAARTWDFSSGPLPVLGVDAREKKDDNMFRAFMRTPGETETLEAVEENLSKPAFDTIIRFVYFSPHPLYYDSFAKRGVVGSFNQYAAQGLNAFVANNKLITLTKSYVKPYVFPKTRGVLRKERILYNYRHRVTPPMTLIGRLISSHPLNWNFASKTFELTTQSLATIFHPPMKMVVTTPHMKRVDSRKAGPPAGLAIFGEEGDVERFR